MTNNVPHKHPLRHLEYVPVEMPFVKNLWQSNDQKAMITYTKYLLRENNGHLEFERITSWNALEKFQE